MVVKSDSAQARAEYVTLRGHYFNGASTVAFTNEMTLQLPDQFKSVVTMSAPSHVIINTLDGVRASTSIDGKPTAINPATLAQLRQTLALDRAIRLVPLVTASDVALTNLGEYTVDGRLVVGVGVIRSGQRRAKIIF
jgi:hypothetical protein